VDNRSRRESATPYGARLTVREIRGLLTRIGAEMARTAARSASPQAPADQARLIEPSEIIEQMTPFLRMN